MLEYYKKCLLDLEADEDLKYDIIKDGVEALLEKIGYAISGIKESRNAMNIKHHREVVSLALNFYLQDLQKNLSARFTEKRGKI